MEKQFWIIKIWVLVIIVVSTIFSISLFVFGYRSFALSIFLASLLATGNLALAISILRASLRLSPLLTQFIAVASFLLRLGLLAGLFFLFSLLPFVNMLTLLVTFLVLVTVFMALEAMAFFSVKSGKGEVLRPGPSQNVDKERGKAEVKSNADPGGVSPKSSHSH